MKKKTVKVGKYWADVDTSGITKYYDLDICYISGFGFFIQIPDELQKLVEYLTEEERTKFLIKQYQHSHSYDPSDPFRVTHNEEHMVTYRIKEVLRHLLKQSVSTRNVIVVHFERIEPRQHMNDFHSNNEHPRVGLALAIAYGVETHIGEVKSYSRWSNGPKICAAKDAKIVLDDTPENRSFLEDLYSKIELLTSKLEDLTNTPERLLGFIESNVKLLS